MINNSLASIMNAYFTTRNQQTLNTARYNQSIGGKAKVMDDMIFMVVHRIVHIIRS